MSEDQYNLGKRVVRCISKLDLKEQEAILKLKALGFSDEAIARAKS